ncbi:phage major capsid protein [Kushneria phosphatilytica]|uniref:Phage major capsid protein n=1 Tax=Kushneria phosphatilytica TaxID=657387 RepID=A0A1S1NS84_9GAMM|nr:phage major capsid protein [Kushneria phosphatilytica]OHV12124.1 capsid protein [Kushneria phosphatilytica]QEL11319.1 phage major capsid protein [Kushneria phosphatilytica]
MGVETIKAELGEMERRLKAANDEQKSQIEANGRVNEELKGELQTVNDRQKELGDRLFELEQSKGAANDPQNQKSVFRAASEEAVEHLKGGSNSFKKEIGSFHKALTTDSDGVDPLVEPYRMPGVIRDPEMPLRIRDLLMQGSLSTSALEYVRENMTDNQAAIVPETQQKPESNFTFEKHSTTTKVIAHFVQASRQAMSDAPQLQSYIQNRLLRGLGEVEDMQFLNGNGEGDNLEGLNTVATGYDTELDASGDSMADKLAHAIYQVTESYYSASGLILNPRDWHTIALMKDGDGRYILGGPQAFASNRIWGLPVVPTMQQTQGTFTVGAFGLASQVWDQWNASVTVSESDRDNFIKNMITILAEERLALAHYRPKAIVRGSFTSS